MNDYDPKSNHYEAGGIAVLDVIQAKLTPEEYRGYLKGNAIKYLLRASFKGSETRDYEKASWYSMWLDEHHKTVTKSELVDYND